MRRPGIDTPHSGVPPDGGFSLGIGLTCEAGMLVETLYLGYGSCDPQST